MPAPDPPAKPLTEDAEALLRAIRALVARGQQSTEEMKRTLTELQKTKRQIEQLLEKRHGGRGA